MKIVKPSQITVFQKRYPIAAGSLLRWLKLATACQWENMQQVRRHFPHADAVKVKSGRIVTVFNICGNDYRLITAIHYNTKIIFVMLFLTHAEYSKEAWKGVL